MQQVITSRLLFLTVLFATLFGCNETAESNDNKPEITELQSVKTMEEKAMTITVTGMIEFKPLEGGFYAFIADDGRKFTPSPLPKEYQRHGLRLTIVGTPKPEVRTITQFGTVLAITEIKDVDTSGAVATPTDPESL